MATDTTRRGAPIVAEAVDDGWGVWETVCYLLRPVASLRLTVVLFLLSMGLVLAGTLAQRFQDIWDVLDQYFRTDIAWIDLRVFFPRSANVPEGIAFPYPGGWTIGGLMALNLFSAHLVRFKTQARGGRLALGLGVIAAGLVVTWAVVASGNNSDEVAGTPWLSWDSLWLLLKLSVGALFAAGAVTLAGLLLRGSWRTRRIETAAMTGVSLLLGVLLGWLLANPDFSLDYSSMRILWQLIKGLGAAGVLLAGCWLSFGKRAGIVLLHGGIGLLMFSELLVGTQAVESMMQIREGQTVDFSQDVRTSELAVVDASDAETDDVVAVPQGLLEPGKTIEQDDLPFKIEVLEYYPNADLVKAAETKLKNPADAGIGQTYVAVKRSASTGTDTDAAVDLPAAYVRFLDKQSGEALGTHLLSSILSAQDVAERVQVGDKTYDVYLRFKRYYKDYSLTLKDVRFDKYLGTTKAKNYSSDLRLVAPALHVDRDVKIWMNNPLRFGGETFYQSQFNTDGSGAEITGLQVVTNTGWMIPYVSCMIVGVGLAWQFGLTLLRFLDRRARGADPVSLEGPGQAALRRASGSGSGLRLAGWIMAGGTVMLAALLIAGVAMPPRAELGEMNLYEFGKLPLVYEGRVKPFDTLARNSLLVISGKQSFKDAEDNRQPAIRWLLDVIARQDLAVEHKVFKIDNLELLNTLGLKHRPGHTYSIAEFRGKIDALEEQAGLAHEVEEAWMLSVYQKKVLELYEKLQLYSKLSFAFRPPAIDREDAEQARQDLLEAIRAQGKLAEMEPPLAVPPLDGKGEWQAYSSAVTRAWAEMFVLNEKPNPATLAMQEILIAYAGDDVSDFNLKVQSYRESIAAAPPADLNTKKVDFEAFFNHFEPFFYCWVLYIAAGLLAALAWLGFSGPLNKASFWLIAFTFAVHTFALLARIYISGRPPVTNLYSSAVFIGWGCVFSGIVLESMYKIGIGNIISGVAGFGTLLIAHYLAGDGDTFIVLQAVLDTQFWLATHVVCITLGYMATFVAGLLGILFVFNRWVPGLRHLWWGIAVHSAPVVAFAQDVDRPADAANVGKALNRMIYGFVCFALLLSFIGTVLGGLWADDSWGRFWGWDPKENGALMIVIWNALVLHARWGGMVKDRGLAVLAILGNVVTAWSWFGVNELGAGLHSYGFTEGVALTLAIVILGHLAIVAAAAFTPKAVW